MKRKGRVSIVECRMPGIRHSAMLRAALCAAVLVYLACDGFFPKPSDFEPSGTEFHLRSGITLVSITGNDQGFPRTGTFPFAITLSSTAGSALADTLPAGLIFRSRTNRVQHVIMLKQHVVTAGSTPTANEVGMFCCNEFRNMPRASDTFSLGPITDNAGLKEIVSLVNNKDISGHLWMVQRAVWMVTDSTGLNSVYRDSLLGLPSGMSSAERRTTITEDCEQKARR